MLEIKPITAANLPDAVRLCLAGSTPGDRPRAFTREVEVDCSRCKLAALRDRQRAGGAAWAAYRSGALVGYLELHAVADALAPVRGGTGHVLQCLRIPEPALREEVEAALVEHAFAALGPSAGLAVVAREKDWSRHGFVLAEDAMSEVAGDARMLWWRGAGEPPGLVEPVRDFPLVDGRVRVDLFTSGRCPWDEYVAKLVRDVAAAMADRVVLFETDCGVRDAILRTGVVSACAVNGRYRPWYRPHILPDEHTIRRAIENVV